jgi:hypothetical protein
MSRLVVVKWFTGKGKVAVHTEMRDWQQPHAQTGVFLQEQHDDGVPAGALLSVYDQDGINLTLVKTHVMFNALGQKSAALKKVVEKDLAEIQARALEEGAARVAKKNPVRKKLTKKKPMTVAERNRLLAELAAKKKRKAATAGKPAKASISGLLRQIEKRPVVKPCNPMFMQGMQLMMTAGVQTTVNPSTVKAGLTRFASCDWGDVGTSDTKVNNTATRAMRGQVRGVYHYPNSPEFNIEADLHDKTAVVYLPSER